MRYNKELVPFEFPLILIIFVQKKYERQECIMRNLRNYLTDSLFQWRIRTACSLAFISGVGKKNRVIRSEVIGTPRNFSKKTKKVDDFFLDRGKNLLRFECADSEHLKN